MVYPTRELPECVGIDLVSESFDFGPNTLVEPNIHTKAHNFVQSRANLAFSVCNLVLLKILLCRPVTYVFEPPEI